MDELHRLIALAVNTMAFSQERRTRSENSSYSILDSLGSVITGIRVIHYMSIEIATATTEQSSVTEKVSFGIINEG